MAEDRKNVKILSKTLTEVLYILNLLWDWQNSPETWGIYRFWVGSLKQLIFKLRQGLSHK